MKTVTMKINATLIYKDLSSPQTFEMVSIYQLDDANKIVSEERLPLTPAQTQLLASYYVTEDEMPTDLRPSSISAGISALRGYLVGMLEKDRCGKGSSISIEMDADITVLPINTKEEGIAVLRKLKEIIPVSPVPVLPIPRPAARP